MLKEGGYDKQTYITSNMISVPTKLEINWWGRKQVEPREMAHPSQSTLLWWWYLRWACECMHNFHCSVRGTVLKGLVRGKAKRSGCGAHPERVHSDGFLTLKGQDVCPLTTWARTPKGVAWRFQFLTKQSLHQSWRTACELSQGVILNIFRCH